MAKEICDALVIDDNYHSDLESYVNQEFGSKEEIEALPDDYKLVAYECESKPIVVFSAEWITERINEEKFSEDQADEEYENITKALNEFVDFEKLNAKVPRLNYPTKHQVIFTKEDLINAF